jgi:RimJ/RimL family protein N-acetyltransferase
MARGASVNSVPAARTEVYLVRSLREARAIRARLEPRRAYSAYALGQLSPRLFPMVACWEARGRHGEALVLFSRGGLGDAVFMSGDPDALAAILSLHRGPRHNFATFRPEHLPVVERYFKVANQQPMMRMAVDREGFRGVQGPLRPGVTVRRLHAADARLVNRLYNSEGQPTFYSSGHIDQGMYHGVFEDRRLVAVAGTHVISPEEGVAVVGNVFTNPSRRGHGHGTLATSATTEALLALCPDVVLTVDPGNTPAVRAYLRLGYREDSRLVEASVTRRSITGLGSLLATRLAAWRGRAEGGELVLRHG